MFFLLSANILAVLSSYFLARKLFPKPGFVDFLLAGFTIFLAQIILTELFLGMAGKLFAPNIIILELIIASASFYVYSIKRTSSVFDGPEISFIFGNKIILFSICVFISFFGFKLLLNLINSPFCADSLQYHLMFPATWVRNGNLNNPIVIFGTPPTSAEMTALSYYPINAELFFFWLMFPLRNAFLADVGEAPFYIIGILAVYSILRKFNLKKDTALLAGMLWALIPNLFKQIRTASQIDVICAVLFLLVLNNLLILAKEFNLKNASFLGLTFGIFFGTKVSNLYWGAALLPLFVYSIFLNYRRVKLRRVFLCLSAIALFTFLLGGFSYTRTYLATGNPFYPVKITIFGKEIFPGIINKDAFSRLFAGGKFSLKEMFFSEGLGAQFIFFIFFGTVIPALAIPMLRKRFSFSREMILLSLTPPIMFIMYLFVIKAYWIRYIFPYLGIGMITGFLFLDKFKWGKKYITIVGLICIFSSAVELAHRKELFISLFLSLLIFTLLLYARKKIAANYHYFLNTGTLVLFTVLLFACFYFLNEKYNREEFLRYPQLFKKTEIVQRDRGFAWKWLEENTGEGRRIAYTGFNEIYPLFGKGIKNDVIYVSVNNKPNLPHYYPDGLYREEKKFDAWRENLIKERIDLLFVCLPHKINNESDNPKDFPIEDQWAVLHPELFREVFQNSLVHIYETLLEK